VTLKARSARELAGIIDELQRQLDQHRADLTKRAYRRNRYFARNEFSRLCLGVLRTAAGEPLSTDDIAGRVISPRKALTRLTASCERRSAIRSGQSSNGCIETARSRRSGARARDAMEASQRIEGQLAPLELCPQCDDLRFSRLLLPLLDTAIDPGFLAVPIFGRGWQSLKHQSDGL
jgi:hypothetical protein